MLDQLILPIFTQLGLPGLIIIGLAYYCWSLKKELSEVAEKRIQEMQANNEKLLNIIVSTNAAIDKLTGKIGNLNE